MFNGKGIGTRWADHSHYGPLLFIKGLLSSFRLSVTFRWWPGAPSFIAVVIAAASVTTNTYILSRPSRPCLEIGFRYALHGHHVDLQPSTETAPAPFARYSDRQCGRPKKEGSFVNGLDIWNDWYRDHLHFDALKKLPTLLCIMASPLYDDLVSRYSRHAR